MLAAHTRFRAECDLASQCAGLPSRSDNLIHSLIEDLAYQPCEQRPVAECDKDFSMGVGYVFEGSAVGASILIKRLAKSGLNCPSYLTQLATPLSKRWLPYTQQLEGIENTGAALAGASAAFEFIIDRAECHK